MSLRNTLGQIAGDDAYRHALFYQYPGGLRVELSQGGSPLDQVLVALRRATLICNDIFDSDGKILVHLQKHTWGVSPFTLRNTLRQLELAGIHIPDVHEAWVVEANMPEDGSDERSSWVNCAFEIPAAKLQNLLWCAFAGDFAPLSPNPHCAIYLAEPSKQLIVHPYDDRGMDIIGKGRACLRELYERHSSLLSEHDRDAMRRALSSD